MCLYINKEIRPQVNNFPRIVLLYQLLFYFCIRNGYDTMSSYLMASQRMTGRDQKNVKNV